MINFIKKNLSKDVLSTGINQIWRIFSGPITLLLIPAFVSPETQGYWYTFGGLSALSILADLGFSTIVLQFAAHEYAYLAINDKGNISGDQEHLNHLASFFVRVFAIEVSECVRNILTESSQIHLTELPRTRLTELLRNHVTELVQNSLSGLTGMA